MTEKMPSSVRFGVAAHGVEDALIFLGRKAVLGDDLGRDLGIRSWRAPSRATRARLGSVLHGAAGRDRPCAGRRCDEWRRSRGLLMNRNRILWMGAALALLGGCQRHAGNEAAADNAAAAIAVAANSAANAAAPAPEAAPREGLELRLAGGGLDRRPAGPASVPGLRIRHAARRRGRSHRRDPRRADRRGSQSGVRRRPVHASATASFAALSAG